MARHWDVKAKTTIVIGSGADAIAIGSMGCPRCTDCWIVIDDGFGSEWCKQHLCEIKRTVELMICQDKGIAMREMEEDECQFHLG